MKMLEIDDGVVKARALGASDEQIGRWKSWRKRGATDAEVKMYRTYHRKYQIGRMRCELALAHGMSPGTLRQRQSRGMTLAQALRKPVVSGSDTRGNKLVDVRRGSDGRWASSD